MTPNYTSLARLILLSVLFTNSNFACCRTNAAPSTPLQESIGARALEHSSKKLKHVIETSSIYKTLYNLPYYLDIKNSKPTYVVGDLDGDFARLIFAAYMSGHIVLNAAGLNILAKLMSLTTSIYEENPSKAFLAVQRSKEVYELIKNLQAQISYKRNPSAKLIFMGDMLFDRFSNNVGVILDVVKNLYAVGVTLIKGNHDYYEFFKSCYEARDRSYAYAHQGGAYALDADDIYSLPELARKCTEVEKLFVLSHYDQDLDMLFTHAAIKMERDPAGSPCAVYCNHHIEAASSLSAKQINDDICKMQIPYTEMIGWRPEDGEKFLLNDSVLVHGHDGVASAEVVKNIRLNRASLPALLKLNSNIRRNRAPVMIAIV